MKARTASPFFLLAFLLAFAAAGSAGKMMSVQVKKGDVRATPTFLGKIVTTLAYGDRVEVLESQERLAPGRPDRERRRRMDALLRVERKEDRPQGGSEGRAGRGLRRRAGAGRQGIQRGRGGRVQGQEPEPRLLRRSTGCRRSEVPQEKIARSSRKADWPPREVPDEKPALRRRRRGCSWRPPSRLACGMRGGGRGGEGRHLRGRIARGRDEGAGAIDHPEHGGGREGGRGLHAGAGILHRPVRRGGPRQPVQAVPERRRPTTT